MCLTQPRPQVQSPTPTPSPTPDIQLRVQNQILIFMVTCVSVTMQTQFSRVKEESFQQWDSHLHSQRHKDESRSLLHSIYKNHSKWIQYKKNKNQYKNYKTTLLSQIMKWLLKYDPNSINWGLDRLREMRLGLKLELFSVLPPLCPPSIQSFATGPEATGPTDHGQKPLSG